MPSGALVDLKDFPSLARTFKGRRLAYFDGPAGTQVPRRVIDAVSDYYSRCNANTHGHFLTSRESDQALEQARRDVADFLGARNPHQISFGANMTTLTFSLSRALGREFHPGDEIVITALDHEANRGPWLALREKGVRVREAGLQSDGTLDYRDFRSKISERTRLVAMGYASNALGTVNDLARVRQFTRSVGAWLLVDAVHYAPHFPLDVGALGVEFLLCSAYKFYGPHVGILYCRDHLLEQLQTDRLRTQQPRAPHRIETGTLNHASIVGVGAAIDYIASLGEGDSQRQRLLSALKAISCHECELARRFFEGLRNIPGATVYGPCFDSGERAPTVSFRLEGLHPAEVARRLGEKGIQVWDGHFYALRALEILDLADKGGVVRVGMSIYHSSSDVDRLLGAVEQIAGA
ncbi:MAG: cysteine desulfurase-like protein [Acidobacteriota bacterium]